MNTRVLLAAAVLAVLAPACKTWARASEHTITIQGPEKVNRGEDFSFTVTTKDAKGELVTGVVFQWAIDWVGLPGSNHKGKSGEWLKIRVKGTPGKATLKIMGYDAQGNFVEIAKHAFQVD